MGKPHNATRTSKTSADQQKQRDNSPLFLFSLDLLQNTPSGGGGKATFGLEKA